MNFGKAFEEVKKGKGMRLPKGCNNFSSVSR
jgi:hypothetical protein